MVDPIPSNQSLPNVNTNPSAASAFRPLVQSAPGRLEGRTITSEPSAQQQQLQGEVELVAEQVLRAEVPAETTSETMTTKASPDIERAPSRSWNSSPTMVSASRMPRLRSGTHRPEMQAEMQADEILDKLTWNDNGRLQMPGKSGLMDVGIDRSKLREMIKSSMKTAGMASNYLGTAALGESKHPKIAGVFIANDETGNLNVFVKKFTRDKVNHSFRPWHKEACGLVYKATSLLRPQKVVVKEPRGLEDARASEIVSEATAKLNNEFEMTEAANVNGNTTGIITKFLCKLRLREGDGPGPIALVAIRRTGNLDAMLDSELKDLGAATMLRGMAELFAGGTALKEQGLVHLDMKTRNIFVDKEGGECHFYISDFDQVRSIKDGAAIKLLREIVDLRGKSPLAEQDKAKLAALEAKCVFSAAVATSSGSIAQNDLEWLHVTEYALMDAVEHHDEKRIQALSVQLEKLVDHIHTWALANVALALILGQTYSTTPEGQKAKEHDRNFLGTRDVEAIKKRLNSDDPQFRNLLPKEKKALSKALDVLQKALKPLPLVKEYYDFPPLGKYPPNVHKAVAPPATISEADHGRLMRLCAERGDPYADFNKSRPSSQSMQDEIQKVCFALLAQMS